MNRMKKLAFLVQRPDMPVDEFRRYWREVHGPLVAGSPGYVAWRTFYAQNHPLRPGPVGHPFAYSGMAVFVLPGQSPNEDRFSQTDIYRGRIAPDEAKFIDMDRTVSFATSEHLARNGRGPTKLVVLIARPAGTEREEFRAAACKAAEAATDDRQLPAVAGWALNFAVADSLRLPGGRVAYDPRIDLVHEIWFDSPDGIDATSQNPAFEEALLAPAGPSDENVSSFVSEELVFFPSD